MRTPVAHCRNASRNPATHLSAEQLQPGIQPVVVATEPQADDGQRRRPERSELEPGRGAFEERIRCVVETDDLSPGVGIRVLAAPVVVLAADPVIDGDRFAVDLQRAVEDHLRALQTAFAFGSRVS